MIENHNKQAPAQDPMLWNLTDPNQARRFLSKARIFGVEMFEGRLPDGTLVKFDDATSEQLCFFAQTLAGYIDTERRARKIANERIAHLGLVPPLESSRIKEIK